MKYNVKIWRQKWIRILAGLLLVGVVVRALPYGFPIRPTDIAQNQLALEFTDRNGLPLGTLLSQDQDHTAIVSLDQVSPRFIQAIIAAEDQRYFQHGALDLPAIARAVLEAVQAREIVSGASTITMQLARMLDNSPRTFSGKALEIWTSWRLFAGMNRQEILQAYVNRLPMGGNLYGVEAASRVYFGVPAADLTWAQASLLAALPNDPTDLNPYENWSGLKQRQRYVLEQMVEDRSITVEQMAQVLHEDIQLQPREQGILAAPHFLFWVSDQFSDPVLNSQPDSQPSKILQNSVIQTTLDRNLQDFAEGQVDHILMTLKGQNVHHAAVIVIDNHSREVLAYVGSPDYLDTENLGQNDGVQALRQPGSTLKPFLYELALEKRVIHPNTILPDVPTYYGIPDAKLYTPTDYSETFLGPVRVRIALANSLNIPAVKVLEKVGVPIFLERLHDLGFQHLTQSPEYYGLGLTLGSGEVNLWELAQAYGAIANQGELKPLKTWLNSPALLQQTVISSQTISQTTRQKSIQISSSKGDLEDSLNDAFNSRQIDSPATWQLITDILSDRHARATAFGVNSILNLPVPAAVKTGTSSDYRDTWTVGFTPDYTVATWVGNFDGTPMQKVSGVTGAAPLWSQIMLHLHQGKSPQPFTKPTKLVQLPICATTGLKPTETCSSGIVSEYFYPETLSQYQQNSTGFELTSEYHEWLSKQSAGDLHHFGMQSQVESSRIKNSQIKSSQIKIISPQKDDYFLTLPGQSVKLQFKVMTDSQEPIEWRLNHQKLAVESSANLFWEVPEGEWELQVQQGENRDLIQFQVRAAESKPYHRGFSVIQSADSLSEDPRE
ncbi:MAG: penicillin-binding protein 1C [Oscillatoriales cyanobacterium RM2_1_1]|nr:penicillin-binding protein 1C [Oscillatoriales cyanobacterium SM2_3_0]NJO44793.1 penicillin-binding protein 1C [Oscillatoriales cyanobacterium RM2_1_1]